MEHVGETLTEQTITIDGNCYEECRFENCTLVYRGGVIPTIGKCHFQNCQWQFEDGAERTLLFLKQLYHGMGPGGVELVEATLGRLRENPNPPGN